MVSVSVFYNPRGSEGPSETPFGERSGDFGVPRAPSEIGERPPWAPWASPRDPSRLPLSGPGRKQMGPSQHRKSQFHTIKTMLSAMPSFDNPPFNWSHNFLTVFLVFSSASLPFFCFLTSSHSLISISSSVSARDVPPGLLFWPFFGSLGATGAIQGLKTV